MPDRTSTFPIQLEGVERSFHYREQSQGDVGVLKHIFLNRDYDLARVRAQERTVALYDRMLREGATPLIIDAGANIGASAVWFSGTFPRSHIVAVEPEPENFELLRRNCEGLNCSPLQGGIACDDGEMYLVDPGESDWGYRLSPEQGEHAVPVYSAAGLVELWKGRGLTPFLFKIDIEGGESDLFRENTRWMSEFPLIIIELHDWLFPGSGNSKNFLRSACELEVDFVCKGENVFLFNTRLLD